MSKPALEFLEIMIINACNLSCKGCTTFSDLKHTGYVTWQTGKNWLEPWTHRLEIQSIGLMGGEPLINPDIKSWITGIRELLPSAQIRFVTNGLLLRKHWYILDLLEQVGNSVFKISYHTPGSDLDSIIDDIMNWRSWEPVTEYGIDRWKNSNGMRFQLSKPMQFLKTFKGQYENMAPHNSDPKAAFKICVQKRCPMLNQGRLWKCGTLALTPPLLERMGRPNWSQWQDFIDQGLAWDCSANDLESFVNNFGKPHMLCRQCPTENDFESRFDHLSSVQFKKEMQ